jgi:chaperonin GroES
VPDEAKRPRHHRVVPMTDPNDALPITLLHDRVLVEADGAEGERRTGAGIVIPATASVGRRFGWARVVGIGPNVRTVEVDDRVLYDPEDLGEVELQGRTFTLMRERDIHAVAATRLQEESTGLYL